MTKSRQSSGSGDTGSQIRQEPVNFEPPTSQLNSAIQTLCQLAVDLESRGEYQQAVQLFRQAVALSESSYGPTHSLTVDALEHLASILRKQHGAKAQSQTQPSIVDGLYEMALFYHGQGRYLESANLYRRLVSVIDESTGAKPPSNSPELNDILSGVARQGSSPPEVREEHAVAAEALTTLAEVQQARGRMQDAASLHQRALQLRLTCLNDGHPDVADSLSHLGTINFQEGLYAQAEAFFVQSLAVREKSLGPDHPYVAVTLNQLGETLLKLGRLEESKQHLQRVLLILQATRQPDQLVVSGCLQTLGDLHCLQGRYKDSEDLYQKSLVLIQSAPESKDLLLARCLNRLARVYRLQGRQSEAEALCRKSLALLNSDKPALAIEPEAAPLDEPSPELSGSHSLFSPPAEILKPQPSGPLVLSDSQVEVLRLISAGYANQDIASRLDMSSDEVQSSINQTMRKLSAQEAGMAGRCLSFLLAR